MDNTRSVEEIYPQRTIRETLAWPRVRKRIFHVILHLILIACGLVTLLPFMWMLSTSLKPPGAVFIYPPRWIPSPMVWQNYRDAWVLVPMGLGYLNSLKIAISVTLGVLFTSTLAAYAFAKLKFAGQRIMFMALLATMMVPGQVTLVPTYILYSRIDWINTHWPLILPPALTSAFGVFLIRQYYLTIPDELEDAAKIDGCNPWQIYLWIMLPLSGPPASALAIFTFMGSWNDFLSPLVFLNSQEKFTIPLMVSSYQGLYGTEWTLLMAAATIALLPVLVVYVVAQRYFIQGIALTGLKA